MKVGDIPGLIEKPDGNHDGLTREALIVHETCLMWTYPLPPDAA